MTLPEDFITYTRPLFGDERWRRYLAAFDEDAPVSVRVNPFKAKGFTHPDTLRQVEWCREGYYLRRRPDFTSDPLLHAGAYYVQEAGSMFLDEALRQLLPSDRPLVARDLCAAPGGKSTLLRAALPESSALYSNEPDRRRANILAENMQKQGHPQVVVTNNFPADYRKAAMVFDFILADVPCSGEGMFRKDEGAIVEWSVANVTRCAALQRGIVADIWPCLKPGGLFIYSTCTFNLHENEENVRWICEEYGAEPLTIETEAAWSVTGSLWAGWRQPVYRFIPGVTQSEGLFLTALRKPQDAEPLRMGKGQPLKVLCTGEYKGEVKGKTVIPDHAEALLFNLPPNKYPSVELSHDEALRYLRREAVVLPPETPCGFVIVRYEGLALGFVKNIGTRANNLYPMEWRIRKNT